MLTLRAVEGGTLPHDAFADRSAAAAAGLPVATVYEILLLEVAWRAIAADEIPQRAATGC